MAWKDLDAELHELFAQTTELDPLGLPFTRDEGFRFLDYLPSGDGTKRPRPVRSAKEKSAERNARAREKYTTEKRRAKHARYYALHAEKARAYSLAYYHRNRNAQRAKMLARYYAKKLKASAPPDTPGASPPARPRSRR